ncbi:MAG: DegT/DnrJ/EryC1/StrS family aminotransferase [Chloroflexi bacterium]|nr:DegT/DnrJ/EryC1/StrS family aminotransferase [Chloroflexota bacterium]
MPWRVPLADLDYGDEEAEAVLRVVRSRWLTMGAVTQQFEEEFARTLGVPHAVAVSNATQALHLACLALEIGPGDEVVAPSLTFVATTNAILYAGAEVRFADISHPCDLNISPREIEKQITDRTRALMVMHYGGFPCAMDAIMDIAERHHLAVIEDAAHAPGASLNGRTMGTWGDVGCFSFFSNKNLATGEGGMLVTNRDDVAERVRLLRSHGMTTLTWDRHQGHAHSYDVVDLGYNYRIDEIRSALGLEQLRKLAGNNARRKAITETYWQALDHTGLEFPFRDSVGEPAYHIFPMLLPDQVDRERFMDQMRVEGIQTSIHYPPIHKFSYYQQRYPSISLPLTEAAAHREVTLPLYPGMADADIEAVVSAVKRSLKAAQAAAGATVE